MHTGPGLSGSLSTPAMGTLSAALQGILCCLIFSALLSSVWAAHLSAGPVSACSLPLFHQVWRAGVPPRTGEGCPERCQPAGAPSLDGRRGCGQCRQGHRRTGLSLPLTLASSLPIAVHRDLALHHPDLSAAHHGPVLPRVHPGEPSATSQTWPTVLVVSCQLCLPAGSCGQVTHPCGPQQRVAVRDSMYWALERAGVHPGGYHPLLPQDMPLDAWRARGLHGAGRAECGQQGGMIPGWPGRGASGVCPWVGVPHLLTEGEGVSCPRRNPSGRSAQACTAWLWPQSQAQGPERRLCCSSGSWWSPCRAWSICLWTSSTRCRCTRWASGCAGPTGSQVGLRAGWGRAGWGACSGALKAALCVAGRQGAQGPGSGGELQEEPRLQVQRPQAQPSCLLSLSCDECAVCSEACLHCRVGSACVSFRRDVSPVAVRVCACWRPSTGSWPPRRLPSWPAQPPLLAPLEAEALVCMLTPAIGWPDRRLSPLQA